MARTGAGKHRRPPVKPWLGSKETEIEKAHRELLRALVIEMQNILLRRGVKTALIGGHSGGGATRSPRPACWSSRGASA